MPWILHMYCDTLELGILNEVRLVNTVARYNITKVKKYYTYLELLLY